MTFREQRPSGRRSIPTCMPSRATISSPWSPDIPLSTPRHGRSHRNDSENSQRHLKAFGRNALSRSNEAGRALSPWDAIRQSREAARLCSSRRASARTLALRSRCPGRDGACGSRRSTDRGEKRPVRGCTLGASSFRPHGPLLLAMPRYRAHLLCPCCGERACLFKPLVVLST